MSCIKVLCSLGKSVDEPASILCLNDDCLEYVFKYLEIKDQVNLASSCMRFRDVFDIFSKIKYQIVHINEIERILTPIEMHKFFEIAGPNIKDFYAECLFEPTNISELLDFYCTNLKSLEMVIDVPLPNPQKLLHNKPLLENLNLFGVDFGDDISIFKNVPKLKRVTLQHCKITGNSIKDLINIEELDLTGTHITCIAFTDICENLKELKILHITEISQLEKSSLMEAVKHLIKLEALHIDGSIEYIECFAQIPNLIELWINGASEDFFEVLGKYQKNQLQKLIIDRSCMTPKIALFIGQLEKLETLHCLRVGLPKQSLNEFAKLINLKEINLSDCRDFGNEDLLDLIKSCRRLQSIDIDGCTQISNSFAKEVLKLLIDRKSQQGGILHISANGSGINRNFVNTLEFELAKELLKFNVGPEAEFREEQYDYRDIEYDYWSNEDDDWSNEDDDWLREVNDVYDLDRHRY